MSESNFVLATKDSVSMPMTGAENRLCKFFSIPGWFSFRNKTSFLVRLYSAKVINSSEFEGPNVLVWRGLAIIVLSSLT